MAKYNLENYLDKDGLGFPLNFRRGNPNPLDNSSVWNSLAAAENYAKTDPTAYVGQILSVVNYTPAVTDDDGSVVTASQSTVEVYYIKDEAGNLEQVGTSPVGDENTIIVADDGTISLYGIDGLELTRTDGEGATVNITYQPLYVGGKLTWVEPSATTVEGLAAEIEGIKTTIGDLAANVGEGTVSEQIDEKIEALDLANTYEAKGAAANVQANVDALTDRVADVEGKSHEHANKEELDKIVDGDKAKWDAMEQNAKDYAEGLNTDMGVRVKAIEDDYLTASDKTELTEAIATAKTEAIEAVLDGVTDDFDTLKEVAAWIQSDTTASSELISRVSAIEEDYLKGTDKTAIEGEIDALSAYVGDLPESAASQTVVAYIQEVIDGLKIGDYAKASELSDLVERVVALEGKAHEHSNKDVIDGITAEKVTAWDASEQNAKDYTDEQVNVINTTLDGKVNVEDGKRLMTDAEGTLLATIEQGAQVNKIESVDETQFGLDEAKKLTLLDIAIGKVTGLQDVLDSKANNGATLAEYGITDAYTKTETENRIQEVLDGLSDTSETAASVAQALETYKTSNDARVDTVEAKLATIAEGAQVNVIEQIKVGETVLDIVNKSVAIPVGAGLKASTEITIAEDGALGIGEVNVNKLVQTDGEDLILNGGSAG